MKKESRFSWIKNLSLLCLRWIISLFLFVRFGTWVFRVLFVKINRFLKGGLNYFLRDARQPTTSDHGLRILKTTVLKKGGIY